jgi:hypothetical protein
LIDVKIGFRYPNLMIGTKVYSTIQQIRDAKRRERQQKWKQKIEESRIKRIVSLSLRGSEKKQIENTTKFIKAEVERKTNARERKRRSRAMTKERNEWQKLKKKYA